MGCVMRAEIDRLLLVAVCAGLESLKVALRLEGELVLCDKLAGLFSSC